MSDVRYPIGNWTAPSAGDVAARQQWIAGLAALPQQLRQAVAGLDATKLATPYREGGWTVQQVVHHLADSHMNAYVRTKLALTEDTPAIKVWDEVAWAELADAKDGRIEVSLQLVAGIHERWVRCLSSLAPEAFQRGCQHPERGLLTVHTLASLYAWHGSHHVAHITSLRQRRGW